MDSGTAILTPADCRRPETQKSLPVRSFEDAPLHCPLCKTHLTRSRVLTRVVVSLAEGVFLAKERVRFHSSPIASGSSTSTSEPHRLNHTLHSLELARQVPPGKRYAYEVMVSAGLQRYHQNRQAHEIAADLTRRLSYALPPSSVNDLSHQFLDYLAAVHYGRADSLAEGLASQGGYVLHIDGTQEGQSDILFVCSAYLPLSHERSILHAEKVNSENSEDLRALLLFVKNHFSDPLAILHDMAAPLLQAAQTVFPGVPQFVCQYHFLRDVGKEICNPPRKTLAALFHNTGVGRHLCNLKKEARRTLHPLSGEDQNAFLAPIHRGNRPPQDLDAFNLNRALLRALLEWIQGFSRGSHGQEFPFDHPLLRFYHRCLRACEVLEALLQAPLKDSQLRRSLQTLFPRLARVRDEDFTRSVREYQQTLRFFEEIRQVLRLPTEPDAEEAQTIPQAQGQDQRVPRFLKRLQKKLQRPLSETERSRCQVALTHFQKYAPYLTGHTLTAQLADGSSLTLVAPRTNNLAEQTYHHLKHSERRRTGRKNLSKELQEMPADCIIGMRLTCRCIHTVPNGPVPQFALTCSARRAWFITARPLQCRDGVTPRACRSSAVPGASQTGFSRQSHRGSPVNGAAG